MNNSKFADLSKGKVLGHPIHSMLIHFPSALFPTALVFDLLAVYFHDNLLAGTAFYMWAAGLVGGCGALIFGAIDYYRIPATHKAWGQASLHALLNIVWLCLFTVIVALRIKQYPNFQAVTLSILITTIIGVLGLIFSNYLGGELVFKHKIGIEEISKSE